MTKLLPKILLALFFWGVFIFVILAGIPYPNTLTAATPFQLLFFLIPLFLSLTFTINIATRFLIISIIISMGIILILILKALDILNLVSTALTILAVYFFISYFKKNRLKPGRIGLLKESNKSKLPLLRKLKKIHE